MTSGRRSRTNQDGNKTREKILDAAELLFAENGYDAVPIRDIMDRAGTRLGLMTYYFASKEALLVAVVERRSAIVNARRRTRLARIAGTPESSIELVIDIMLQPFAELINEEGSAWKAYARLNAQLAQSPRWTTLIKKNFDEVVSELIDELDRILPQVPRAQILQAFVIALGAMLATLATSGRMRSLSSGYVLDEDFDQVLPLLGRFMAGGFRRALNLPNA